MLYGHLKKSASATSSSRSSTMSCQQPMLLFGLLLMTITSVASQLAGGPVVSGNFQTTMQSQMLPSKSNAMSSSLPGTVQGSTIITGNRASKSSDDSSNAGVTTISASGGSGYGSESGSWGMDSESGSSSLEYECDCRSIRRVSLMGASDYCLAPSAALSSKCGNVDLGESGACPMTGAQPCSSKGHVLANDSFCALDNKDETYKCVASKSDLEIQKKGGKKKKKSNRRQESESSMSTASPHLLLTAHQVVAIIVCAAVGVMTVV